MARKWETYLLAAVVALALGGSINACQIPPANFAGLMMKRILLIAVLASVSPADGSPITIAKSTAKITIDQLSKIDVYISENQEGSVNLSNRLGGGNGTMYWTLDGQMVATSSIDYDQSLPVPTGTYNALLRLNPGNLSLGTVLELDNPSGSSDFSNRQSIQIHAGNWGGNSEGCIVSSALPGTAWGTLRTFFTKVTSLHKGHGVPATLSSGANLISTPTAFETVLSNRPKLTELPSANTGQINENYSIQTKKLDLPITVHVSGEGSTNQPYINLTEQGSSTIAGGQPENFTLALTGVPSYGFGDRDVIALVRVSGAGATDDLALSAVTHGLSMVYDTTNAYGTFYDVLISKTTNSTNFTLTTNSSFSGKVDVSVVGYREQLYIGSVPHKGPMVPDGQVMLENGVHKAEVSIIGVPAHSPSV
jgi:hypothetical protein